MEANTTPATYPGTNVYETAYTHTKLLRKENTNNTAIAIQLQQIIKDMTETATRTGATILANTIRLEARPTTDGTELTLRAFAKQNLHRPNPVDNKQTPSHTSKPK